MKLKPVYMVSIEDQNLGYIGNKDKFKQILDKNLQNNEEENIAFADLETAIKYEWKFVDKNQELQEEQVMLAIKEKADITYFEYAILVDGEEKAYVKNMEQANEIESGLQEKLGEEANIVIKTIYTKNLNIENEVEIANVTNDLILNIEKEKEEKIKKEASTISGVYISVIPVHGTITSRFGARESIRSHGHKGLDIAAKEGTPIKAAAEGKVTYSGTMGTYGNLIIIDHGNGIKTYYGHCSKLIKKVGDMVNAGDVIANVGSTGNSTGPHLHFEIRKNGEYVNPISYLYN